MQKLSLFVATFALVAMAVPNLAFAHGNNGKADNNNNRGRGHQEQRVWSTNEFGVHIFGSNVKGNDKVKDNNKNNDHGFRFGFRNPILPMLFYNGTVTAVSSTGFTIETKDSKSFTVTTTDAKIIEVPRKVITLANVKTGDTVHITGTLAGVTITASVVYDLPVNLLPAAAKGTVTAVTDNTLTVQTKDNTTITVNTDNDTQVVTHGNEDATTADIQVGAKVKLLGLWDNVKNVFNAVKIKLFA